MIGFISAFEICHPINCHTDENNNNQNNNNNNEAVVSHINSRNDKSSSTESATIMAPLHYVTHKNHRDQEVGVDHIFIRPMISSSSNSHISSKKGTDKTPNDASEKSNIDHSSHDDNSSSTTTTTTNTTAILTTTSSTISTTTSTNTTDTSLNSSHNSQSNLSEIASTISSTSSTIGHDSIPSYRIFVNTSQVLPTHLTCHYWKDDFHISDHRPIKTNIILMKNE